MQLNREKLEDIVGLYRDPPEHALVLSDRASRKSGGASKGIRRADGSWRLLIRGLTASANSWYVTRRLTGPTLRSTCSPPPSSAFEKCRRALILFTDKLLVCTMSLNASFSESANPFGRGEVLIVFVNVEAKARSRGLRPCWEARRRKRYRRPGGDAEPEAGEKNRGMETDL